jgi:hypothetical protein
MRRASFWAITAVMVAGAVSVAAKEKFLPVAQPGPMPLVAEKTDPAVAQLIKDLGDDDYRTREKAGRELVALGEKVLPQLRAALAETDSPEVQRRLSVMIRKMDTERLVAPKRVTMNLKNVNAKAAIDEIAKQTGYKIEFGGGSTDEKYTFEFDNTPFWVAVDRVAAMTGCLAQYEDYNEMFRVYNQDAMNPYVAYAGPFRFLASNINSNDSIQLSGISRRGGGGTQRYSHMNLGFQIQSEPKNPMLGVGIPEIISAVDENGTSMVMPRNPNDRSYYYNQGSFRGHNTYGNLTLTRGDKTATKIKSLKAKVGIVLLSGTSPEIVVPEPLKVQKKTFVGRTMEIDLGSLTEDKNNKGHYSLELTARKLGENDPNRPDYNWGNTVWQRLELVDAAGNAYRTYGPSSSNNNNNVVQMTIPYGTEDRRGNKPPAKLGPPVKLVVNEWLSITHEVTFEFKDVPLP